ncbi:hypothetical protein ACF0H5_004116 [Mactra antiquata]
MGPYLLYKQLNNGYVVKSSQLRFFVLKFTGVFYLDGTCRILFRWYNFTTITHKDDDATTTSLMYKWTHTNLKDYIFNYDLLLYSMLRSNKYQTLENKLETYSNYIALT